MKSLWFKRLKKEVERISPHIRFKRLKMGFWRIYFQNAYLHEVYEEMEILGRDIVAYDPRLESRSYYEEYEDHVSSVRTIKNYKEGYYDSIGTITRRLYMLRNSAEFNQNARQLYSQVVVK